MSSKQSLENDIFLAYGRADRDYALNLYKALSHSCKVFIDSESMYPGDVWSRELREAQQRSLLTAIVLSRDPISSPYLRDEIASAISLHRRFWPSHLVVPIYLDETSLPTSPPYGLDPFIGIYNGRGNVNAVSERLVSVVTSARETYALIAEAATVKPAQDLSAGGAAEADFVIEDFIPDLYAPCDADRAAAERWEQYGCLLIEGKPKSGKTRLARELILGHPEAVVFIPKSTEPPPDSALKGLSDREVILFADALNRAHLETDLVGWRSRLEAAAGRFRMVCAAEDGKGLNALQNHPRPLQFLQTLPTDARLQLNTYTLAKEVGWTLAERLGVRREQFDIHFDGTAWSVIFIRKAERFRSETQPMNNLPSLPHPLGREREIKSCLDKLIKEDFRLLTIHGPSGVGKTVLGTAVAQEIFENYLTQGFEDGVCFVDASKIPEPRHLPNEIASALGFVQTSDSSLVSFLATKHMLLMLDNFEYVSSAAGLVRELAEKPGHLKLLITSQAPLSEYLNDYLSWEGLEPLKPLDVSTLAATPPAAIKDHPAVQVFIARLRQLGRNARPSAGDYKLIAEICLLVQGLPLALQIVASYSVFFGLRMSLGKLRGQNLGAVDTDKRLHRAFLMSYDQLGGGDAAEKVKQQGLLRRLTVFAGSFTYESVGRLYEELGESPNELDNRMLALARRSLLEVGDDIEVPRYQMLQSIKAYAHGLLESSGEVAVVRAAHAGVYAKLVRAEEPRLNRPGRNESLNLLEAEHGNLAAALQWCAETAGEEQAGADMAGRLFWFWNMRSYFNEGREWARLFLNKTEASGDTEARAKALYCDGGLGFLQGHYEEARGALTRSVEMWRRLGGESGLGYALIILGMVQSNQEEIEQARLSEEESVRIFRKLGDRWGLALALNDLGNVVMADGDRTMQDAAFGHLSEAQGETDARARGLYDEARRYYNESRGLWEQMNDDWGLPLTLTNLGTLSLEERNYDEARRYFEQALDIHKATGGKWGRATALRGLGRVWRAQGDLKQAVWAYYKSYMLHREIGRAQLIAECLDGFADIAARLGQAERAGRLLGAAKRLRDDWKLWKVPGQAKIFEMRVARARGGEAGDAFERAMQAGYAWGPQEQFDAVTEYVSEWTP